MVASLHSELELLVETGLTPREALSTSVISGPKFFELDEYYGDIEVRKVAHIILLTENPLENIKNIGSIDLVLKGDQIYDRSKLKALKTSTKMQ